MTKKEMQSDLDPRAWTCLEPYIAAMQAAQKKMDDAGGRARYPIVDELGRIIDQLATDNVMRH